jgi:hypothetical protein
MQVDPKNFWREKTAENKHAQLNTPINGNRALKKREIRIQVNNALIELTNSLFTGNKKFELRESSPEYQGPVIKFNSLAPGHWASNAIMTPSLMTLK